jgi:hypothetical protein
VGWPWQSACSAERDINVENPRLNSFAFAFKLLAQGDEPL